MSTRTKPTLSFLVSRFISRPNLAEKSRSYYDTILKHLEWYARTHHWPGVEDLTREHIRSFLDYVITEPKRWPASERMSFKKASPATIHHYGRVVKTFFTWAEDEEYLEQSPARRFKPEPPHYKLVEPYRDEEITAMLQVCENDVQLWCPYLGIRNKAIISLFVATGLRVQELSRIKLPDFDVALQQVDVLGKGNKARAVPVNGEARKALKRYLQIRPAGGEWLWKTDDGKPLAMYSVKVMIARLKRRAGVTSGGGAHRFRHYFATRYLEAGGDINSLRLLLGHASLDMVLKYSRYVDGQRALATHRQFNPLDQLYRGQSRSQDWRLDGPADLPEPGLRRNGGRREPRPALTALP
jgi:site-specific recombinase XerD